MSAIEERAEAIREAVRGLINDMDYWDATTDEAASVLRAVVEAAGITRETVRRMNFAHIEIDGQRYGGAEDVADALSALLTAAGMGDDTRGGTT